MYCVVQKIQLKKPNLYGEYREYEVQATTITAGGQTKTYYSYYPRYEAGRFDRPHREAYKITVCISRRESGKVKKTQYSIGTVGYYDLAGGCLYDYIDRGVERAAQVMGMEYEAVYKLVEDKVEPIRQRVKEEFQATEEYQAASRRQELLEAYRKAKAAFVEQYHVEAREYDACYNVFGEVMDPPYLERIKEAAKAYRSYSYSSSSTYNWSGASGYCIAESSTYNDTEKAALKRFYKTLAIKFHPDTGGTDEEMKLLNRLKDEWGI